MLTEFVLNHGQGRKRSSRRSAKNGSDARRFYLLSAPGEQARMRTACRVVDKAWQRGLKVWVWAGTTNTFNRWTTCYGLSDRILCST